MCIKIGKIERDMVLKKINWHFILPLGNQKVGNIHEG